MFNALLTLVGGVLCGLGAISFVKIVQKELKERKDRKKEEDKKRPKDLFCSFTYLDESVEKNGNSFVYGFGHDLSTRNGMSILEEIITKLPRNGKPIDKDFVPLENVIVQTWKEV